MRWLFALLFPVCALAAQAPYEMPPTPEPWRSTDPAAAANFSVLLSPGVAPAVVHVNGLVCPLPVGTPLTTRYDWDFGEPGTNYDHLTGFNAAHIYDHAGKYTITLTVTDEAGTVRKTDATVMIEPDRRRTLFVAPGGSDKSGGRSEDAPMATLDRAVKDMPSGGAIRLKAGGTYFLEQNLTIGKSDVVIGRYGDGPDPVLMLQRKTNGGKYDYGSISTDAKCNGVLFDHLSVNTPYEVADDAEAAKIGIDAFVARGKNITFRDCTFRNVDNGINSNGNPTGLLVQHCSAPDKVSLRAYLVWGQGTDHVYLGNTVANSTREHCVRLKFVDRALIFDNDFTNLDRRPADKYDTSKGCIEMHLGTYAYIVGNRVTSGTIRVGPRGESDEGASTATNWCVVENNQVHNSYVQAWPGSHHVMIRNNVVRRDDDRLDDAEAFIVQGPDKSGRESGDVTIVHNTFVDAGIDGTFFAAWGKVDGITLSNNLFVAPRLRVGKNNTGAVLVNDADLASFREISHNVWPALPGDACLIANKPVTAADWSRMTNVTGDGFTEVTVDDHAAPMAALAVPARPGVHLDASGRHRPPGTVSAGAVEPRRNKSD